jgi:YD repeat-containing protein
MVSIVGGSELGLNANSGKVLGGQGETGTAGQGRAGEGVTVNAVTGNLVLQRRDEFIAGQGLDLNTLRTYNSRGEFDGDNDDQWALSYSRRITGYGFNVFVDGDWITRANEEGVTETYIYESALDAYVYRKGDGSYDTITLVIEDEMVTSSIWTDGTTQTREIHDFLSGTLQKIVDINGNELTINRNANGLVTSVVNEKGEQTEFVYGSGAALNNVLEVRTRSTTGALLQTRVRYGYDGSQRLTSVTVDLSPTDNSIADGKTYVTTYTYDGTSKRIASISQTDGSRLEFTYVQVPAGGDYRVRSVMDKRIGDDGLYTYNTTSFNYDLANNRTLVIDGSGRQTFWSYDANGQVQSIRQLAVDGGLNSDTWFSYDSYGNVLTVTDPLGNTTTYGYDAQGNRTLQRDTLGNTITRTFNDRNQLTSETTYTGVDPDGNGSSPATGGRTQYFVYDANLNLAFTVSPEGRVTRYSYDAQLRPISEAVYVETFNPQVSAPVLATLATWANGQKAKAQRTDRAYDTARGVLASTTRYTSVDANGNGVDGATTHYIYNQAGQLLQTIDANDGMTQYTYDGLGRIQTVLDPSSKTTLTTYDDANRRTTINVDVYQNLGGGSITALSFDEAGLLLAVEKGDSTTPVISTTRYVYDKRGNLVREIAPNGASTYHLYDAMNRRIADIDPAGAVTEYRYDDARVATSGMYTSQTLVYTSPGNIKLNLGITAPQPNAAPLYAVVKTYANGVLLSTANVMSFVGNNPTTASLNNIDVATADLLTVEIYQGDVLIGESTNTGIAALREQGAAHYLAAGSVPVTEPVVTKVERALFKQGEHISRTIRYITRVNVASTVADPSALKLDGAYNGIIGLRPATTTSDRVDYQFFDAAGRLIKTVDTTGAMIEHFYDGAGQRTVTQQSATRLNNTQMTLLKLSTSTLPANHANVTLPPGLTDYRATQYAYSADGLLTGTFDADGYWTVNRYDAAGQLIETTRRALSGFDKFGVSNAADLHTYYLHDGKGQLTGVIDPAGYLTEYRYDAVGNTTSETRYANAVTVFDPLKPVGDVRPTTISAEDRTTAYAYDGFNQLIYTFEYQGAFRLDYSESTDGLSTYYLFHDANGKPSYVLRGQGSPYLMYWAAANADASSLAQQVTNRLYDSFGRVVAEMSHTGYKTLLTPLEPLPGETPEQLISRTQARDEGLWTRYTYDASGRMTSKTEPVDSQGHASVTLYFYDGNGRLIDIVDSSGTVQEMTYNAFGEVASKQTFGIVPSQVALGLGLGQLTPVDAGRVKRDIFTYNQRGELLTQTTGQGSVNADGTANQGYEEFTYNAFGELATHKTLTAGSLYVYEQFGYNKRGLLTSAIRDQGAGNLNLTTLTDYDAFGRATKVTDARGNEWNRSYDKLGRVITVTDPGTPQRSIQYDAFGRVIKQIDVFNKETSFVYNAANRTLTTTTPELIVTTVTTDAFGQVISLKDGRDNTTTYTYDLDGRLLDVATPTGSGSEVAHKTNVYDGAGHLIEVVENGIKTAYTYDAIGRVLTRTVDPGAGRLNITTRTLYNLYGENIWVPDSSGIWTQDASGVWTQTRYDLKGEVTAIIVDPLSIPNGTGGVQANPNGLNLRTDYAYDSRGNQVKVTEGVGSATPKVTVYEYDKAGRRIAERVDPNGTLNITTSYTYDANDNVIARTDANDKVTRYVYDASNRQIYSVDGNGSVVKTGYDAGGRVVSTIAYADVISLTTPSVLGLAIDENTIVSRLTTANASYISSASNQAKYFVYDKDGRVTLTYTSVLVGGVAQVAVSTMVYDNAGNLTRTTRYTSPSLLSPSFTVAALQASLPALMAAGAYTKTDYTYDNANNQVAVTDGLGNVGRSVFNAGNQLVYTIDATGAVVKYQYDAAGRVTQTTAYANRISLAGLVAAPTESVVAAALNAASTTYATNPANQINRSVYDKNGHVRFSIDGLNYVTEQKYDAAGDVIRTTRYFKALGLSVALNETDVAAAVLANTDPKDQTTYTVYDKLNRATWTIDAEGYATQSIYDAGGRVTKQVQYFTKLNGSVLNSAGTAALTPQLGSQPSGPWYTTSALDRTTRHYYDGVGNERFKIDAENYVTAYEFDARGRETRRTRYVAQYNSVADNATLAAIQSVLPVPSTTEPVVQSFYDGVGNLVKTIDGEGSVTDFTYNNVGLVTSRKLASATANQAETIYTYDAAGRLIQEQATAAPGYTVTTRYVLDAVGNRTQIIDPRGVELSSSDTEWALATRKALQYVTAGVAKTASQLSIAEQRDLKAMYTIYQQFDALGRVTRITDPAGVEYATADTLAAKVARKAAGIVYANNTAKSSADMTDADREVMLNKYSTRREYDAFGNAVRVIDPRGNSGYFYFNQRNEATAQVDPEGYVTKTQYSAFGTIDSITRYATAVSGATVQLLPAVTEILAADQTTRIDHDKRNLQTKITDAENKYEEIGYDAFGNKTTYRNKVAGVYGYTYDRLGRVKTETTPAVPGYPLGIIKEYEYDQRGNITKLIEAKGLTEQRITYYAYDRMDRQIQKTGEAYMAYDPITNSDAYANPVEYRFYDKRGNLIEIRIAQLPVIGVRPAVEQRTLYYYDLTDRKIAEIDPAGWCTTYKYNSGSKPISEQSYAVTIPAQPVGQPPAAAAGAQVREKQYSYDANNRLVRTTIPNVLIADQPAVGATANIYTTNVSFNNQYDAAGNLIVAIDGRGNATYYFYDRAGRRVAQVDAASYLTTWQYDHLNNVTQEYRYANVLGLVVDAQTSLSSLRSFIDNPVNAMASAADRITQNIYDRLGQLKQKSVLNVAYGSVNATNGDLNPNGMSAAITSYSYNGLGKVTQQIDATGLYTDFDYDLIGQRISEKRPGFIDYTGAPVRPETDYEYNGLGLIKREIDRGTNPDAAVESDDHITNYNYTTGGLLSWESDPSEAVTRYRYDVAGNVTSKTLVGRINANGATVDDTTLYVYDAAGREILRKDMGTDEVRDTRYNAAGEITGKGLRNSTVAAAVYQEVADFDAQGRVWRGNSGDGSYRLYVYDANGNATLMIQSAGLNFAQVTLDQIPTLPAGGQYQTISRYDARNLLIDTSQPSMQTSHNTSAVGQFQTQPGGQSFSAGAPVVGPIGNLTSKPQVAPVQSGTALMATTVLKLDFTYKLDDVFNNKQISTTFTINLSDISLYGTGDIDLNVTVRYADGTSAALPLGFTQDTGKATWFRPYVTSTTGGVQLVYPGVTFKSWDWDDNAFRAVVGYDITILKQSNHGAQTLLTQTYNYPGNTNQNDWVTPASQQVYSSKLFFDSQPTSATSMVLFYRPVNTTQPWVIGDATKIADTAGHGRFLFDCTANGLVGGYEFRYLVLNSSNDIVNAQTGTFAFPWPVNIISQTPLSYGGAGASFLVQNGSGNTLHIAEQGSTATSLTFRYRAKNSTGAWSSSITVPKYASKNGWFVLNLNTYGLTGSYDYIVEAFAGASRINKAMGSFTYGDSASVTALQAYEDLPEMVHFSVPSATSMQLEYFSGSTWITAAVVNTGVGSFDWDATNLVPDRLSSYTYSYRYKAYNGSLMVGQAHGSVRLGLNGAALSNTNDSIPTSLQFKVDSVVPAAKLATLATMKLFYRNQGTQGTGGWTQAAASSITLSQNIFTWDASSVVPPGVRKSLEYYYELVNTSGQLVTGNAGVVIHVDGLLTIGEVGIPSESILKWQIWVGAEQANTIHRSQTHDAFGNVATQTDGRNNITYLKYNTLGALIEKDDPIVSVTDEHGAKQNINPITKYYYDLAGRLIATKDPNANLNGTRANTLTLLPGTGSDGQAALVSKEFHADNARLATAYDVFGNARLLADGTQQEFDKNNRLVKITRPQRAAGTAGYGAALVETYTYDQAGNRILHEMNALPGGTEKTFFDSLGRVTGTKTFEGVAVIYSYDFDANIAGVSSTGGYKKLTWRTNDAKISYDSEDYFGHLTQHQDFGGHTFTYKYNAAGWLTEQTSSKAVSAQNSGQNIAYTYYGNGYLKSITDLVTGAVSYYEYDNDGNRVLEQYKIVNLQNPQQVTYFESSDVTYDALNRIVKVLDPKAEITYEYDANSNRRRVRSYYHDGISGDQQLQDYWYTYDLMNRFLITMGDLSNGSIVRGVEGVAITYNGDTSQRTSATYYNKDTQRDVQEFYTYTADGYLEDTFIKSNINDPASLANLRTQRVNDARGRVVSYLEFADNPVRTTTFTRISTYNSDSLITDLKEWDGVAPANQANWARHSTFSYVAPDTSNYTGLLYATTNVVIEAQSGTTTYNYTYSYEWWDDAKQLDVGVKGSNSKYISWKPGLSHFIYDVNGHVKEADDLASPVKRSIKYTTDAQGLILLREEYQGSTATLNADNTVSINGGIKKIVHAYYYLDGKRIGDVGNDGVHKVSYAEELAAREAKPNTVKDKYKYLKPIASADFDQNYEPINSLYPAATASSYTTKSGDTLRGIASAVWGDGSLWYLIADANGLSGNEPLEAGLLLVIPNKVTNIHNNSSTYKVYNPAEAMGDTSPSLPNPIPKPPPPPKKKRCGGLGMILMAIVAVAVAVFTAGAALAVMAPGMVTGGLGGIMTAGLGVLTGSIGGAAAIGAAMIGGAIGSLASQGVGMALGMQDSISWTGVALGAIGAGVGAGVGQLANGTGVLSALGGDGLPQTVGRAMLSNAGTQGIGVATGLQEKFSWTQVAVAAAGSAVSWGVSELVGRAQYGGVWDLAKNQTALGEAAQGMIKANIGSTLVRGTLSGVASGGVQSAITHQRPNWGLIAADSFGQALGNEVVASQVTNDSRQGTVRTAEQIEADRQELEAFHAGVSADLQQRLGDYRYTPDAGPLPTLNIAPEASPLPRATKLNEPYMVAAQQADTTSLYSGADVGSIRPDDGLAAGFSGIFGAWRDGKVGAGEAVSMAWDSLAFEARDFDRRTAATTRLYAGLGAVGSAAETAFGLGLTETGAGALVGIPLMVHGVDNLKANALTAWTGERELSLTTSLLMDAGVSERYAEAGNSLIGVVAGGAQVVRMGRAVQVGGAVDDVANQAGAASGAQWNEYLTSKYGADNVVWDWPKNKGFVYGADEIGGLQPGELVGRLGNERGTFVSPLGTAPETLSLRPGTDVSNLNVYRVIKEIPNTRIGPAAPAFDMPGYGVQKELPSSVKALLKSGHLERVTK